MITSSLACSDSSGSVRLDAFVLGGAIVVLLLVAAMPALAATGDGVEAYPTFQYDAQRTGAVSGTAPDTATVLWQSSDKTAGCVEAGPIVHNGKVYVSTWWSSGMGVAGDAVDALYCLDQESGEEIWNNSNVYGASTAAIAADRLFIGTQIGNLTCVNASSGTILWSEKVDENPSWYGVTASPLVVDDMVYVLSISDGTLHAFLFNGTESWNFSTGGELFTYASPAACDDNLFFAGNASNQHALYCVNRTTHKEVWNFTTETEVRGSPTIWSEEDLVFFTTKYVFGKPHRLYGITITTGEEAWNVSHYTSWASPALSNGKLFLGGSGADTTFYCYNAINGSLLWYNDEMGGSIDSSPVVADGKVYFGTNEVDGTVYALDVTNGSTLWNYTLQIPPGFGGGFSVASHPAVADHTLFIGADNNGVLAFRDTAIWEGDVTLVKNTICTVTAHDSGECYELNQTTALGALFAASEAGIFNYTVSDEWYTSWGCLLVESIADIASDPVTWDGWLFWVNYPNDSMPMVGVNQYEVKEGDVVTYYYGGMSATPANSARVITIHVHTTSPYSDLFDTCAPEQPYPSTSGRHYGTLTPSHDVNVTTLFTRACEGTGGHTEQVRLWNDTWSGVEGHWNGYNGDWHNISFDSAFRLNKDETYYYLIETGAYPQIHHTPELLTADGTITCTNFTDANGAVHYDWIPAIRLC
jgi:outer membrane protein assembly factor BamB